MDDTETLTDHLERLWHGAVERRRESPVAAKPDFTEALAAWVEKVQAMVDQAHAEAKLRFPAGKISVDAGGKKYLRVVKHDGGVSRSAFAFVEVATGAVLKAESWKRPARGARGSIYGGDLGVGVYGAHYAR